METEKNPQEKDLKKKDEINTPKPPQRVDPRKKWSEQDKGGKDRNKKNSN